MNAKTTAVAVTSLVTRLKNDGCRFPAVESKVRVLLAVVPDADLPVLAREFGCTNTKSHVTIHDITVAAMKKP